MTARPGAAPSPLREALALCGWHLRSALLFSALVNLGYLAPTLYMLGVYDMVVPSGSETTLALFTAALCATLLLIVTLDRLRTSILASASVRLDNVFSTRIYRRAMRAASPGRQAVNPMIREADTIRAAVTGPAALAFMDAPWTPIYIAACFLLHPLIGWLSLVGCVLLFLLAIWNERATRGAAVRAQNAAMASFAAQDAAGGGADVVRALGMTDAFVRQFEDDRRRAALPQMQAANATGGISAAIRLLRLLFQSGALGLGAWLAIHRDISAGAIFAASMLASRALAPVDQIVAQWRPVSQALTAYRALVGPLSADETVEQTRLPPPAPSVALARVSVLAPARDRLLLREVSMEMRPGEVIGVIGASGAGKTTLLQVLANARVADQGDIRIDGARYLDWRPELLGRHIGYIPQDSGLFPGSVKDNIARFDAALGLDAADIDARVVAAAKQADSHQLILSLPSGYDTMLGPQGRGLSAGQRQRVALARALYGEPSLFVFDEPNAHLDGEGERALVEVINGLRRRKALVVFSAQRLTLMSCADKLVVLKGGRLERFGPARDVMESLRQTPSDDRKPPALATAIPSAASTGMPV